MSIARALLVVVAVAMAVLAGAGCDDCGHESIPHCPGPNGGAECIDGHWHCVLYDAAVSLPPDLAPIRD